MVEAVIRLTASLVFSSDDESSLSLFIFYSLQSPEIYLVLWKR